jgi:hypothetical protein
MNKQQIVEWIKKNERQAKVFIIGFYGFVMLLMFACYPQNFTPDDNERVLSQTKSNHKKGNVCQIEDYKLYKFEEPLVVPFLQVFINGLYGLYRVYDIMYVNKSGEKSKFFTYKCPLTYGLDVIPEDVYFVIEESLDVITIYYDKEPVGGFNVEKNPFSKKIQFKFLKDTKGVRAEEGACY